MMLILGLFVFSVDTTPYQQLKRASSQRWASNSRIGARPHYQYLGPDEESIALSGTLYPELTGGQQDLAMLNAMALSGKPYALLSGNGEALGLWVIEQVEETHSHFHRNGAARKIAFNLSLKRVDDDKAQPATLGGFVNQLINENSLIA
ncbi:phage tail protein [Alteromonas sp. a30]|nr:phage tail protein [Alteromonas sp. a30]